MAQTTNSQNTNDILRNCLNFLPQHATQRILSHLQNTINYEPMIGIMGKTGAGKSSLCNALFQQPVCLTSDLMACTREPQRLMLTVGERSMTPVDLPGMGETPEKDETYLSLYQQLLAELDLVIWVLRADDRALATDISTHRALLNGGADPSRFLFVLSQADRVPPVPNGKEWQALPDAEQCLSLAAIISLVAGQLPSSFPVMVVSAHTGYNLSNLVELMVHALPAQAISAVYRQLKSEHKSAESESIVRQRFGELAGSTFDSVIDPDSLPSGWRALLCRLREKLVQLATGLRDKLFS